MRTPPPQFAVFVTKWGTSRPTGVAVASDGSVYVSSCKSIEQFTSYGALIAKWGMKEGSNNRQFYCAQGVAVGSYAGSVYIPVANEYSFDDSIQKFTSEGVFVTKWGKDGPGDGQFKHPVGVAVAPDGSSVYVVDSGKNRIQKFTSNGVFVTKWGTQGSGDGQFKSPDGVAVAPDGSVYVADEGNDRIQKFTSAGEFDTKWGRYGSGDGQFKWPGGVAVAPDGSVYVVDTWNYRIQKFTSDGVFVTKWGTQGSGDGQFGSFGLNGVAVAPDGSVYVSDSGNHRIQKFTVGP